MQSSSQTSTTHAEGCWKASIEMLLIQAKSHRPIDGSFISNNATPTPQPLSEGRTIDQHQQQAIMAGC